LPNSRPPAEFFFSPLAAALLVVETAWLRGLEYEEGIQFF
jgi:hypothetical protein